MCIAVSPCNLNFSSKAAVARNLDLDKDLDRDLDLDCGHKIFATA